MAARFRAGRQTLFDLSLLQRLQTSYSPYDIGMNPYREFLFLTDPSHSEELTDKMLVTALKKLSKSKGYIPRYENSVLEKYAYDISRVHVASSQGYTRDDLEGYLHGISILQLAGNISTFTRGLRDYFSEYTQNKKLEKRVSNVESGKEGTNNKSSDVRERILKNLQESQKARESSNFSEYAKREKEFLKQVSEGGGGT